MKINQVISLSMVIGIAMSTAALNANVEQFSQAFNQALASTDAKLADIDAKIATAPGYAAKIATLAVDFPEAKSAVQANFNYQTAPIFTQGIAKIKDTVDSILSKLENQVTAEATPLADAKLEQLDTFKQKLSKAIVQPFIEMDNETTIRASFRARTVHVSAYFANQICPTVETLFGRIDQCKNTIAAKNAEKVRDLEARRGQATAVKSNLVRAAEQAVKTTKERSKAPMLKTDDKVPTADQLKPRQVAASMLLFV